MSGFGVRVRSERLTVQSERSALAIARSATAGKVRDPHGQRSGHHAIGRHSVASQAATGGESIKAIQAQLGHSSEQSTHKYAHLGSKAQLRVVEVLTPTSPPHLREGSHCT